MNLRRRKRTAALPRSRPADIPVRAPKPVLFTPPVPRPPDVVVTDGKFFRVGAEKFFPKGVSYGPFEPDNSGSPFPSPDQVRIDFDVIRRLNANCLRVYFVPPRWFLDLARDFGLKVLVDYTWPKHTCFLDDEETVEDVRRITRRVAEELAGHPAVFALTLANEIPPDIARWYGFKRIGELIDELASIVKAVDPQRLVTYANYPPTEFLQPDGIDFASFNVYLHDPRPFGKYLDRLQSIAGSKPLVLSEFGIDSMREGEEAKTRMLAGHIELAFRAGLAGTFIFTFTDDWHTGGFQIEDWFFGLTDRARNTKSSFEAVARQYRVAPYFPLPRQPKVSVVVASHNGGRTLPACLDSLTHLNYPDYEVILVDDGSTDDTARIAAHFPRVQTIRQKKMGLSAARNAGIAAATGDIVAFTDSDCRADTDWLFYLIGDLLKTDACGIGGHNLPPPEDGWVAACVASAPGGPTHVMLDDRTAEHIPGCNMAFWKWALDEIQGFDPVFTSAGDDVDVCWRLQQRGRTMAFSHSGFVWHYRRNTVLAYLQQQRGYGIAEALLRLKHPEYFSSLGGMRWRGRIYGPGKFANLFGRFVIYHGIFASSFFQTLYAQGPVGLFTVLTSLEWHVVATLGLALLSVFWHPLWPLAALSLLAGLASAVAAASRVNLEHHQRRRLSKPLIALLYLLQPIVRGWPRYGRGLAPVDTPREVAVEVRALAKRYRHVRRRHAVQYWTDRGIERMTFLHRLLELLERDRWNVVVDSGWDSFDLAIVGDRFSKVIVKTVAENHGGNKRLIRAQLAARWTLPARVGFAAAVVYVALLLSLTRFHVDALPAILLIPLVAFYLNLRSRRAMRLGLAFLDHTAQDLGLIKLDGTGRKPDEPSRPADTTPLAAANSAA